MSLPSPYSAAPFSLLFSFFFFNHTATTEIYTLSLHDALPISTGVDHHRRRCPRMAPPGRGRAVARFRRRQPELERRSEEHTSELQSRQYLVCRLLLEKKKNIPPQTIEKTLDAR